MKKLSQKDIRALKIGAVAVIVVFLIAFAMTWFEHWLKVRKELTGRQVTLKTINPTETKNIGLLSTVPVFEMPQFEKEQKFLFRDKLKEHLKKIGIKTKPLQILATKKSSAPAGYKLLLLKCTADKCKFDQILDLLAVLKENPYLVGIEELKIKCDPKKREEFKLDLTVSTFVK